MNNETLKEVVHGKGGRKIACGKKNKRGRYVENKKVNNRVACHDVTIRDACCL